MRRVGSLRQPGMYLSKRRAMPGQVQVVEWTPLVTASTLEELNIRRLTSACFTDTALTYRLYRIPNSVMETPLGPSMRRRVEPNTGVMTRSTRS